MVIDTDEVLEWVLDVAGPWVLRTLLWVSLIVVPSRFVSLVWPEVTYYCGLMAGIVFVHIFHSVESRARRKKDGSLARSEQ